MPTAKVTNISGIGETEVTIALAVLIDSLPYVFSIVVTKDEWDVWKQANPTGTLTQFIATKASPVYNALVAEVTLKKNFTTAAIAQLTGLIGTNITW